MLKYMLDTNIVINTMKKKPASVRTAFKKDDGRMGNSNITSITEPSLLRHRKRRVANGYRPSVPPSSQAQPSDPSLRFYGLPLKGLACHVGMEPPRSDGK